MPLYSLQRVQQIPIDLTEAWDFFSDPRNLALITPPWLAFRIVRITSYNVCYTKLLRPWRERLAAAFAPGSALDRYGLVAPGAAGDASAAPGA